MQAKVKAVREQEEAHAHESTTRGQGQGRGSRTSARGASKSKFLSQSNSENTLKMLPAQEPCHGNQSTRRREILHDLSTASSSFVLIMNNLCTYSHILRYWKYIVHIHYKIVCAKHRRWQCPTSWGCPASRGPTVLYNRKVLVLD